MHAFYVVLSIITRNSAVTMYDMAWKALNDVHLIVQLNHFSEVGLK